ncbi:hypothetical protein GALMADRAFT_238670 [Galerina marginata CBS 339.88]|uniref:PAS domain-containing protein n=1 Tax=Galerina marginata (strain CBS 339.88) TaxID=685588 RepID=A0A067TVG9_GALM3|nr:hypothetical protein GALMADRAFT_238670 [Galerina marginata CBS 339.88]
MNTATPCLSFIGIVDFSQEAKWLFMTESVTELLGFEPHELIGRPSLELVHPDEFPRVKQLHYDTIQQDKAAVLVYLRMRHKDPYRGYVLCGVSRTVVHNVLVGSVSFASPGKALHNASTAQEITVITPSATDFEFRRWGDPSPMPASPIPQGMNLPASPSPSTSSWGSGSGNQSPRESRSPRSRRSSSSERSRSLSVSPDRRPTSSRELQPVISFDHLSNKSFRTAMILDRFSMACPILYCSNDLLVASSDAIGRSFYDFVEKKDEEIVRDWITCVKGWGVNEKGQPSDGGFGFGKFSLLTEGRDSVPRIPEPSPMRNRHGSTSRANGRSGKYTNSHTRTSPTVPRMRLPTRSPTRDVEKFKVDAIFSAHSDGLMVILRRA